MTKTPILQFENVNLRYSETEILKNINLEIADGEHCAILGPNGSGKSTLIKLISSELYPSIVKEHSQRKILGEDGWNIAELRRHIGIVTNDLHNSFSVDGGNLTGLETVMSGFFGTLGLFPHQIIENDYEPKAKLALERLGIARLETQKIGTMSTGELRKCLVARALVHPVRAILLDEPTVGLDIKAQLDFIEMMRTLANGGTTIILITHHIEEVFEEISKVLLIKNGRIFAQGAKQEVLNATNLSQVFDVNLSLSHKNGRYSIEVN